MAHLLTRKPERYVSDDIVKDLKADQIAVVARARVVPHLGVILAQGAMGEVNGSSARYVDRKAKYGREIGAESTVVRCGRHAVSTHIQRFNRDRLVHGTMVQLQFPAFPGESPELLRARTEQRLAQIDPAKDVDGLRPDGSGFPAATPASVMRLLRAQTRVPLSANPNVLVVGSEGFLLGRHMKSLLGEAGITPIQHDKALYPEYVSPAELEDGLRQKLADADVVVSCVGRPGLITPDMLHGDMVIIDAGFTVVDGHAMGDLDPSIAGAELDLLYTGPTRAVGPLTVCELWEHTIQAAANQTR